MKIFFFFKETKKKKRKKEATGTKIHLNIQPATNQITSVKSEFLLVLTLLTKKHIHTNLL